MDKPLYVCYSLPLRNYLTSNDIRYEIGGRSMTTNKPFWVYVRNKKLDFFLDMWSKMQVKKNNLS